MKKHSWVRVTLFKSECRKCGCTRVKDASKYPVKVVYEIDGSEKRFAGYCGERFVVKEVEVKELLLF